MKETRESGAYLTVIRLSAEDMPLTQRIRETAPLVKKSIEALSGGNCQLAFTSQDGSAFGWLMRSARDAGAIARVLKGELGGGTAALLQSDSVLVVEIGPDFSGHGFTRAWTWIQHHGTR